MFLFCRIFEILSADLTKPFKVTCKDKKLAAIYAQLHFFSETQRNLVFASG